MNRFCGICGALLPVSGQQQAGAKPFSRSAEIPAPVARGSAELLRDPAVAGDEPREAGRRQVKRPKLDSLPPREPQSREPRAFSQSSSVGVSGPSFLGLGREEDEQPQERVYDADDLYRTNWGARVLFALIVLAVVGGLGYMQWRGNHPANPPTTIAQPQNGNSANMPQPGENQSTGAQANSNTAAQTSSSASSGNAANNPASNGSGAQNSAPSQTPNQTANQTADESSNQASDRSLKQTSKQNSKQAGEDSGATSTAPTSAKGAQKNKDAAGENAAASQGTNLPNSDQPPPSTAEAENNSSGGGAANGSDNSDSNSNANSAESAATRGAPSGAAAGGISERSAKENSDEPVKLAEVYINGEGVPQNCDEGIGILRAADARGNTRAMIKLGALYATGQCVPLDRVIAYHYFSKAHNDDPKNEWVAENQAMLWANMNDEERQRAQAENGSQ